MGLGLGKAVALKHSIYTVYSVLSLRDDIREMQGRKRRPRSPVQDSGVLWCLLMSDVIARS